MHDDPLSPTAGLRRLLLSVPTRRRIFEAIMHCPGTHLRRLSRELDMAIGSVEHHLRQLEKHGLVFSHQDGRRRTYYAADSVDREDAALLHALRKPLWADILAALVLGDACSVAGVAQRSRITPEVASYHLRRMRDHGLLTCRRVGRERMYAPVDPDRVLRLLGSAMVELHAVNDDDEGLQAVVERARRLEQRSDAASDGDTPDGGPGTPAVATWFR